MIENLVVVVDGKFLDMSDSEGEYFRGNKNSYQTVGKILDYVKEDGSPEVEYLAVESFDSG